ncbi:transcriptional regulator FixK [compost metagenome]
MLENNRSIYQKLDLVSHKSLRDRIIHYLTLQAKKNNAAEFEISFTRSDLADYLTVDRSALSRELQRMAQDGLIRFTKNRFELLDLSIDIE